MNYFQLVWHVTVAGTGVCPNLMILFYFVRMLHKLFFHLYHIFSFKFYLITYIYILHYFPYVSAWFVTVLCSANLTVPQCLGMGML